MALSDSTPSLNSRQPSIVPCETLFDRMANHPAPKCQAETPVP